MSTSSLTPRRGTLAALALAAALVSGCGLFESPAGRTSADETDGAACCDCAKGLDAAVARTDCAAAEPDCCELALAAAEKKASASKAVELKETSFKGLTAFVKAQKGKVVVVDVWGTFCAPCKEEFPNLVAIHNRHAKDGVVCTSVAVNSEAKEALEFLKSKKAAFANFLLDEDQTKVLADKWDFSAIPAVFVYDRDGKEHRFTNDDPDKQFTYKDVNALLAKLLAKK